jgi:hypothetical protein
LDPEPSTPPQSSAPIVSHYIPSDISSTLDIQSTTEYSHYIDDMGNNGSFYSDPSAASSSTDIDNRSFSSDTSPTILNNGHQFSTNSSSLESTLVVERALRSRVAYSERPSKLQSLHLPKEESIRMANVSLCNDRVYCTIDCMKGLKVQMLSILCIFRIGNKIFASNFTSFPPPSSLKRKERSRIARPKRSSPYKKKFSMDDEFDDDDDVVDDVDEEEEELMNLKASDKSESIQKKNVTSNSSSSSSGTPSHSSASPMSIVGNASPLIHMKSITSMAHVPTATTFQSSPLLFGSGNASSPASSSNSWSSIQPKQHQYHQQQDHQRHHPNQTNGISSEQQQFLPLFAPLTSPAEVSSIASSSSSLSTPSVGSIATNTTTTLTKNHHGYAHTPPNPFSAQQHHQQPQQPQQPQQHHHHHPHHHPHHPHHLPIHLQHGENSSLPSRSSLNIAMNRMKAVGTPYAEHTLSCFSKVAHLQSLICDMSFSSVQEELARWCLSGGVSIESKLVSGLLDIFACSSFVGSIDNAHAFALLSSTLPVHALGAFVVRLSKQEPLWLEVYGIFKPNSSINSQAHPPSSSSSSPPHLSEYCATIKYHLSTDPHLPATLWIDTDVNADDSQSPNFSTLISYVTRITGWTPFDRDSFQDPQDTIPHGQQMNGQSQQQSHQQLHQQTSIWPSSNSSFSSYGNYGSSHAIDALLHHQPADLSTASTIYSTSPITNFPGFLPNNYGSL